MIIGHIKSLILTKNRNIIAEKSPFSNIERWIINGRQARSHLMEVNSYRGKMEWILPRKKLLFCSFLQPLHVFGTYKQNVSQIFCSIIMIRMQYLHIISGWCIKRWTFEGILNRTAKVRFFDQYLTIQNFDDNF